MNELSIETANNETGFRPGDKIGGSVKWQLENNPEAVELSLFWRTEGKGTEDFGLAETVRIENPGSSGERSFEITAPKGPFSFSGKLISIIWALELTIAEEKDFVRRDIVISPSKKEVVCTKTIRDEESPEAKGLIADLFKKLKGMK